jgi:arginine-tRNA-protein transferase
VSAEHLALFERYHRDMHRRRGWPLRETSAEDYINTFLVGDFDFAYEFRYVSHDRIVGIGLVDLTPAGSSSAYFYHDPDWRQRQIGVFSLLIELQVAAELDLPHHYLGYWIAACPSMAYKCQYRPHEILKEYVPDSETPEWQPEDASAS